MRKADVQDPGRAPIDDHLECRGQLHREFRRARSLDDPIDEVGAPAVGVEQVRAVGRQSAALGVGRPARDDGNPVTQPKHGQRLPESQHE